MNMSLHAYSTIHAGKAIVSAWIANVQQQLPRVAAELEGLALGLGMPADIVYLLNMQDEVNQLANETAFAARQNKAHCMDYLINKAPSASASTAGARFHAHNEDGDTSVPRFALWLNATYTDAAPGESASFFAFVYPGQLAGNAFGFTGAARHVSISAASLCLDVCTLCRTRSFSMI